jgi:hypothetical protein
MNKKLQPVCLLIPILALGLVIGVVQGMSQGKAQPPMHPPTAQLNRALQEAGASPLSSMQEQDILAFVKAFRDAHKTQPDASIRSARAAYERAILSGDSAMAVSQAQVIASAQAAETLQREKDSAVFAIGVLSILRADSIQFSALKTALGETGVVRLVLELAGRPGGGPGRDPGAGQGAGRGGGPRGRGPGGPAGTQPM